MPDNIEPSKFRPGEYVGYDGTGHAWNIGRIGSQWTARPAANHPGRWTAGRITERTLAAVSLRLAERNPNRADHASPADHAAPNTNEPSPRGWGTIEV
jgi:hypothetical protein